ncbi:MAG: dCTP deaminase [Planctomycetota bacterium]
MILARDAILRAMQAGEIKIDPFDEERVGTASVDLTVSRYFRRLRPRHEAITLTGETDYRDPSISELIEVPDGAYFEVDSREMVLGITQERVGLSESMCGWFDGRSRFARLGLLVHISAGFMQPGTFNHTVLEIFNMSPRTFRIHPGTPICQFIFQRMEGAAKHSGRFRDQTLEVFRSSFVSEPRP